MRQSFCSNWRRRKMREAFCGVATPVLRRDRPALARGPLVREAIPKRNAPCFSRPKRGGQHHHASHFGTDLQPIMKQLPGRPTAGEATSCWLPFWFAVAQLRFLPTQSRLTRRKRPPDGSSGGPSTVRLPRYAIKARDRY